MQFSGKIGQIVCRCPLRGWRTPSGKSWICHCVPPGHVQVLSGRGLGCPQIRPGSTSLPSDRTKDIPFSTPAPSPPPGQHLKVEKYWNKMTCSTKNFHWCVNFLTSHVSSLQQNIIPGFTSRCWSIRTPCGISRACRVMLHVKWRGSERLNSLLPL